MDETKITITLRPIYIERIIYWLLIILLAVLLIISYLGEADAPEETTPVVTGVSPDLEQPGEDAAKSEVEEVGETCFDGEKNQDETDVDCGGSCGGCALEEVCESANDCLADYCVDNRCASEEPVDLSGDVELKLLKVETEENTGTGAEKITKIQYSLTNGLEEDLNMVTLKVFVKSKTSNDYCLNQAQGQERDCLDSYAQMTVPGADSGETTSLSQDLSGLYTGASYVANYGSASYYEPGDSFNVWIYLYDVNGNQINDEIIAAFKTVN